MPIGWRRPRRACEFLAMKRELLWSAVVCLGCAEAVEAPEAGVSGPGGSVSSGPPGGSTPPGSGLDAAVLPLDADLRRDAAPEPDAAPAPEVGVVPDAAAPVPDAVVDAMIPVDMAEPDLNCVPEVCNGADEDCDGLIDEGADCPCEVAQYEGQPHLFCDQARPWPNARELCQAVGYDLVIIETAELDAWIYQGMRDRGFGDSWVGLNDRQVEGQWVWLDGVPIGYEHWDSGEPNDGGGGEDCGLIMTTRNRQTEWDDRPCDQGRPFICGLAP